MADHRVTEIAMAAKLHLEDVLEPGTHVSIGLFKPGWLPAFDHFAVRIAPGSTPWTERVLGVRHFQYLYRFDLFLLCKVTDEDLSLWGTGSDTTSGIFQLVEDVKQALRGNSLDSLLDRTFSEVSGDVQFDQAAAPGFETSERVVIHRARMSYTPRTEPFCVPF